MKHRLDIDTYCGRFRLVADMNSDLAITVSDVWLWLKLVFLLPSKVVVSIVHNFDTLAAFFEVNCATGEGIGGGIFSAAVWFVGLVLLSASLK